MNTQTLPRASVVVPRWLGKTNGALLFGIQESARSGHPVTLVRFPSASLRRVMAMACIVDNEVEVLGERPLKFVWRGDPITDERFAHMLSLVHESRG